MKRQIAAILTIVSAGVLIAAPKHAASLASCLWSYTGGVLSPDPAVSTVGINGGSSSEVFLAEDLGVTLIFIWTTAQSLHC